MRRSTKGLRALAAMTTGVVLIAACGSDDSSTKPTDAPATAAPATQAPDTAAPDTAAPDTAAPDTAAPDTAAPDTAAPENSALEEAAARVESLLATPTPFPVSVPLTKLPAPGTKIAILDAGTPVAAILVQIAQGAAKIAGVELQVIPSPIDPAGTSAALDTALSTKPAALMIGGVPAPLWAGRVKEFEDAGIPLVTASVPEAKGLGVKYDINGEDQYLQHGGRMADFVATQFGETSAVTFYVTPELAFNALLASSFEAELKSVCPGCTFRTVDVPLPTIGTTAGDLVISDLQANTDTTVAVFGTAEVAIGLPQKLETAGLSVKTLGFVPTPPNLEQLKAGAETAGYAADIPVFVFQWFDAALKATTGQALEGDDAKGALTVAFLRPEDITFDTSLGWSAYADFAPRFMKLWGVGG